MSSKLRKLKQQAYEAGRKRDWPAAAEAYAQILEMDKGNPSLLNEYGDVCMKAGDTTKGVRQFLAAAGKYRQTGLLNNAQAVYKKVLRHDAKNLNANWFLAEIRASQGLVTDGEHHALTFLSAAEEVSGEIKEIFHKRCLEIFDLYPESDTVLERVEGIFRIWDMPLEAGRAGCLRACVHHAAGQVDEAAATVQNLIEQVPELCNYAEYTRWQQATGQTATPAEFSDVNTVDLDASGGEAETVVKTAPAADPEPPAADEIAAVDESPEIDASAPAAETPAEAASAFEEFLGSGGELETATEGPKLPPVDADQEDQPDDQLEKDDDGCISIDAGDDTSFDSLLEDAADSLDSSADTPETSVASGSVNLLDEILAEEGEDILRSSDTEQVSTIASEIGRNLTEGMAEDDDPENQYQQGLVYLEMGLHDQAVLAFAAAAADPAYSLRAREMWGTALQREGRLDDALQVLTEGLTADAEDARSALGLRYQAGRILEELDRMDEAQEHYRKVHAVDVGFADVAHRLRTRVV